MKKYEVKHIKTTKYDVNNLKSILDDIKKDANLVSHSLHNLRLKVERATEQMRELSNNKGERK